MTQHLSPRLNVIRRTRVRTAREERREIERQLRAAARRRSAPRRQDGGTP